MCWINEVRMNLIRQKEVTMPTEEQIRELAYTMWEQQGRPEGKDVEVESPFAALRLRTDAAKRYKKVENATAVIWKMLLVAEQRFHKPDATEKMKQVYLEIDFLEGTQVKREEVLAVA